MGRRSPFAPTPPRLRDVLIALAGLVVLVAAAQLFVWLAFVALDAEALRRLPS